MNVLLRVDHVTKRFPGIVANDSLDLEIRHAEIHALLGENGAGKSTLMNILYGLHTPDEGRILWKGQPVRMRSPRDAIALGIGMVHQHFKLAQPLTVLENVVLGLRTGLIGDMRSAAARLRDLADTFHQPIDLHAPVASLSVGEQQRVEILKALYRNAELLILDEPTSVLTPQEAEQLYLICKQLKAQGKSVIFITHKMNEIMSHSDRVSVLRAGRNIATLDTEACNPHQLAVMMVGQGTALDVEKQTTREFGSTVLQLEDIAVRGESSARAITGVSLSIRAGEIVGIAGVDGNGQQELAEAILGLRRIEHGTMALGGNEITHHSPAERIAAGIAAIPGDRHAAAIVSEFDLVDNAMLGFATGSRFASFGFLRRSALLEFTRRIITEYRVKTVSPQTAIRTLSGGNQQRFVIGRTVDRDPRLLVAVQPTRGLDMGASAFVRSLLLQMRDAGKAVLLISMDLDEITMLSDRIAVMHEGEIAGVVTSGADRETVGLLMAGGTLPISGVVQQ